MVRQAVGGSEQPEGRDHHAVARGVEQGRAFPFVDQVTDRAQSAAPRAGAAGIGSQLVALDEEGESLFRHLYAG